MACYSLGISNENWLTRFLQHYKKVTNGSPIFFFVEYKLDNTTWFVMLKEKWDMNFSISSNKDFILQGNLEYHSSAGPLREWGNNLIRYLGSWLSLVHKEKNSLMWSSGLPFPQYFWNLGSSKFLWNGGIYKILSKGLGCKSLSVYRIHFFWTLKTSTCLTNYLNWCRKSSLGCWTLVLSLSLLCLWVDLLLWRELCLLGLDIFVSKDLGNVLLGGGGMLARWRCKYPCCACCAINCEYCSISCGYCTIGCDCCCAICCGFYWGTLFVECMAIYETIIIELYLDFFVAPVVVATIVVDRKFVFLIVIDIPNIILIDLIILKKILFVVGIIVDRLYIC